MSFTVLTDADVKTLLATLTRDDVSRMVETLNQALTLYSTQNEHTYQPHRAAVTRPNGQITLFMASTSPNAVATKIVGCPPPSKAQPDVASPNSTPQSSAPPPKTLQSSLLLCDAEGKAYAVVNAGDLTAFRTALGSMLLYRHRRNTRNVVVFGAGKQALWHIRLALLLRGEQIANVTIVNRSPQRSTQLLQTLRQEAEASPWESSVEFAAFGSLPEREDYLPRLRELLEDADVVFCTTPARTPLFPAEFLLEGSAASRARYISTIGSYTLDMAELDPALLREIVDSEKGFHPSGRAGGAIVVDTREGCFTEAGEVVQAGLERKSVVEVGEIDGFLDPGQGSADRLKEWLESGFVVYKSVGTGVMDLAIGDALVSLSEVKGAGVRVEGF